MISHLFSQKFVILFLFAHETLMAPFLGNSCNMYSTCIDRLMRTLHNKLHNTHPCDKNKRKAVENVEKRFTQSIGRKKKQLYVECIKFYCCMILRFFLITIFIFSIVEDRI
jgi:hypothetical protein